MGFVGDGDALLHTAGELPGVGVPHLGQAHGLQRALDQAGSLRPYSWKTTAMPRGGAVTFSPSRTTSPAVPSSRPATQRSSVVLPAPEGPTSSPVPTLNVRSRIASALRPPPRSADRHPAASDAAAACRGGAGSSARCRAAPHPARVRPPPCSASPARCTRRTRARRHRRRRRGAVGRPDPERIPGVRSGLLEPSTGIVLHNRGAAFSTDPASPPGSPTGHGPRTRCAPSSSRPPGWPPPSAAGAARRSRGSSRRPRPARGDAPHASGSASVRAGVSRRSCA